MGVPQGPQKVYRGHRETQGRRRGVCGGPHNLPRRIQRLRARIRRSDSTPPSGDDDAVRRHSTVVIGDLGVELLAGLALPVNDPSVMTGRALPSLKVVWPGKRKNGITVLPSSMPMTTPSTMLPGLVLHVVRDPTIVIALVEAPPRLTSSTAEVTGVDRVVQSCKQDSPLVETVTPPVPPY